jgi:GrpB-like predicted nucleotidyltransferase (UPF0157 family)
MKDCEIEAPIEITEYDVHWPRMFKIQREVLAELLSPWLAGPIEHVGSTAVPRLSAKPVIDIMAAVESLEASRDAIAALRTIDYHFAPYLAKRR